MRNRAVTAAAFLLMTSCSEAAVSESTAQPVVQPPVTPPPQLVKGAGPGSDAGGGIVEAQFGPARDSAEAVAVAAHFMNNPGVMAVPPFAF